MQRCDREEVAEILRQYGDWLYGKGNLGTAMDQYIKTIPHLEPSYVIKKVIIFRVLFTDCFILSIKCMICIHSILI